jgi:hypothetical protein
MSDKTQATEGDKCKSGRNSRERLKALLSAGVIDKKLTPFMIG